MTTTTNLAVLLRNIFEKFATQANSGAHGTTLACWRATLDGTESNGPEFLEELALIQVAIVRLRRQIAASKILNEHSRGVANRAATGFHHCVQPDVFHVGPKTHAEHYSNDRLGMIDLLSSTLQLEFPEAALTDNQVEELGKEIDELVSAIRDTTEIPPDLKHVLLRHAQFMAWAIRNVDLVGAEGVYDAIGKILITASRLPKDGELQSNGSKIKLRELAVGICVKVRQLLSIAEQADRGLQTLEHLREQLPHLFNN